MRRAVLALIRGYQRWLSPLLPAACRYEPTCSRYASDAIERHGVRRGVPLAGRRLLRCTPFHPGGYDPVPETGAPDAGAGVSDGDAGPATDGGRAA